MSWEDRLRWKWKELPTHTDKHVYSDEMILWSDEKLEEFYSEAHRVFSTEGVHRSRKWVYDRYQERMQGKNVADIGCGLGVDGLHYALNGAHVTFCDIVEDNIEVVKRICRIWNVDADFYVIRDFFNFHFEKMFDYLYFLGSIITCPFDFAKKEVAAIIPFLNKGGYVLMLANTKKRFVKSGAKDLMRFGQLTNGPRTPWSEWYEKDKAIRLFGEDFKLVYWENIELTGDFNWFEFQKIR